MEGAELELERRSRFLSGLIQKKKKVVEQNDQLDLLNVRVRAADMPIALQNRVFQCAGDHLDFVVGKKLDSKKLALTLKKNYSFGKSPSMMRTLAAITKRMEKDIDEVGKIARGVKGKLEGISKDVIP